MYKCNDNLWAFSFSWERNNLKQPQKHCDVAKSMNEQTNQSDPYCKYTITGWSNFFVFFFLRENEIHNTLLVNLLIFFDYFFATTISNNSSLKISFLGRFQNFLSMPCFKYDKWCKNSCYSIYEHIFWSWSTKMHTLFARYWSRGCNDELKFYLYINKPIQKVWGNFFKTAAAPFMSPCCRVCFSSAFKKLSIYCRKAFSSIR